jgi:hypothetical protein
MIAYDLDAMVHRTPMVWDGGSWTPIRHETLPAVPSTYLFSPFGAG